MKTFATLANAMNAPRPSPRPSSPLPPSRSRPVARREWRAGFDARKAAVVAQPIRQRAHEDTDSWRRGSCTDPKVPLGYMPTTSRIEHGMMPRTYYRAKFMRLGTLGKYGGLNPFLDELKQWDKERRSETH